MYNRVDITSVIYKIVYIAAECGMCGLFRNQVIVFMKKEPSSIRKRSIDEALNNISSAKKAPFGLYIALIFLYVAASVVVSASAGSQKVFTIGEVTIGVYALAGIFSSFANISLVLLAVFYGKLGYFTSLIIMLMQFPILLMGIVVRHNYTSIPGLFTNLLTIIAITVVYFSNRKADVYQKRIIEQAVTDRLTGLPNRFACTEFITDLVKHKVPFALVSLDLNNFKSINDTMGFSAGNKVLTEFTTRWKNAVESGESGTNDFIARQEGDEFTLIVRGFGSDEDIMKTIDCYRAVLEKSITVDGCDYYLTGCFGYAVYPDDSDDAETLFTYANAAQYEVKRRGINDSVLRFTPELMKAEHSLDVERSIRNALDNEGFYFCLQPQYDISHKLRGFEALARLKDPEGRNISPAEFIPVAEKVGLIDKVDLSVFKNSSRFFGRLLKETGADISLSINISVRHLMKNDFLDEIRNVIANSGIPAKNLEIEITESIMIDSADKALECINEIRGMGIKIAIDDFGTGYSSLSYLNKFPADMLKVDKSFIDKMNTSDSSKKYVAAIISIGHIMNFDVISEGVEDPEQLETLRSIGCDYIQGYIWGRPLPPEEAEELVKSTMSVR